MFIELTMTQDYLRDSNYLKADLVGNRDPDWTYQTCWLTQRVTQTRKFKKEKQEMGFPPENLLPGASSFVHLCFNLIDANPIQALACGIWPMRMLYQVRGWNWKGKMIYIKARWELTLVSYLFRRGSTKRRKMIEKQISRITFAITNKLLLSHNKLWDDLTLGIDSRFFYPFIGNNKLAVSDRMKFRLFITLGVTLLQVLLFDLRLVNLSML